jgi:hypothetical protein
MTIDVAKEKELTNHPWIKNEVETAVAMNVDVDDESIAITYIVKMPYSEDRGMYLS